MVSTAGKWWRAASDPAWSFAYLADRVRGRTPGVAKALFHTARLFERNPAERELRRGDVALVDGDLTSALRSLRAAVATQPASSTMYGMGVRLAQSNFSDDAFRNAVAATIDDRTLRAMLLGLLASPKAYHPSRFWLYFMLYNAYQIETGGLDHFKRGTNNNYFTWTSDRDVRLQAAALGDLVGRPTPLSGPPPEGWSEARWSGYLAFLGALHAYAVSKDAMALLTRLEEPLVGNPMVALAETCRVSQDLCHTAIELNAIVHGTGLRPDDRFTTYELGAGHGRLGLGLLSTFPKARYVVIDIPPALHVSQWYLSTLLQGRRVFRFREFDAYADIASEFEASDVAFLLPHQAALLPAGSADLFINICSIMEMTREHMALWFGEVERLCRGHFYTKQYIEHRNGIDRISIDRGDYPVRPTWRPVFDRQCEAFPALFEALYDVS